MKKYFSIFFAALLAVACVEPLQPYLGPVDNEPEEGAPVTIEFSLPPTTKADWGYKPTIETMHVAVFNSHGVLKQYQEATLSDPAATIANPQEIENGDQGAANPKYSVVINMSSNERILHFIANSPVSTLEELIALAGSSGEDAILNSLNTTDGNAAYWQRIKLDKIDAYTYQGGVYTAPDGSTRGTAGGTSYTYQVSGQTITVYKGDFIKSNGDKVLDGTGYFMSDYVKNALKNVPLVRNYVEIRVTERTTGESPSNFHPKKFALVYVPKAGSVAPFDTKNNAFATAYTYTYPEEGSPTFNEELTYSDVHGTNYPGFLAGGIDPNYDAEDPKWNPDAEENYFINFSSGSATTYMYERPLPTVNQLSTCILVGGTLDGVTGDRWFMIEITDTQGQYFPFYRGLSYDFVIGRIDGTIGYDSAEAAFNHDPIGDVSGSVTTATIERINDGYGTNLWVEYVDYVTADAENKTIYYTMYRQVGDDIDDVEYLFGTEENPNVTLTIINPDSDPDGEYKATDATTLTGSEYTGTGTPNNDLRWYVATVPLKGAEAHALHSILRIEGTINADTGKKMHRDVHYRVMGTQKFKNGDNVLKATPLDNENAGQVTTLTIYLPGDLGSSMFPLDLRIEAMNGNFTTVEGLPVESGPSLFDPDQNTFYFIKTIEYDDYYNAESDTYTYAHTATFKTTRAAPSGGTNATAFAVLDKVKSGRTSPYFETATCVVTVGNDPVFKLSDDNITVSADATTAKFFVLSSTNETWTLSRSSSTPATVNFTPTSGTGSKQVTVSFPENESETTKTYTIIASLGSETKEIMITHRRVPVWVATNQIIETTNDYFTQADGEYSGVDSEITELSFDYSGAGYNLYQVGGDYITLQRGNNTYTTLTISAKSITSIVITWDRSTGAGATDYAVNAANTSIIPNDNGSIAYSAGSGTNNNNLRRPTTTWTNNDGSDSVSLRFTVANNATRPRIRQIQVFYSHLVE